MSLNEMYKKVIEDIDEMNMEAKRIEKDQALVEEIDYIVKETNVSRIDILRVLIAHQQYTDMICEKNRIKFDPVERV